MSLTDFGRSLLDLEPDELEAFILENPDLADVVEAALAEEDLEQFIAGRELAEVRADAERSGTRWMSVLFPSYARYPFADHMEQLWTWVWSIQQGVRPPPYIAVWFRGGTKSTTAEAACAALGARGRRRYGLYICDTQDQANEHVANVGAMLTSKRFAAVYPDMASRAVSQYGTSRGWSRTRLHTAAGFVIDALGLATNSRGIRVDEERPDFIVLDDLDNDLDGPAMVEKKIDLITKKILPTGSPDLAVLGIQNLVHPKSIFARLANMTDEPADFLADRILNGPIPAIKGLDVATEAETGRHIIVGGTPTWIGYDLVAAQGAIDTFGYTSFLSEAQHITQPATGGLFDRLNFIRCRADEVPPLALRTCWVDPAIEGNDGSDSQGIQIDGMTVAGVIYRLWSWEGKVGPQEAILLAVRQCIRLGVSTLGVETDQGGKTWRSVYREACQALRDQYCGTCWMRFTGDDPDTVRAQRDAHLAAMLDAGTPHAPYRGGFPRFLSEKAGSGMGNKVHRASQMLADYETGGRIVHVEGPHVLLEAALSRFPKVKPFDLVDAAFWGWWFCQRRRGAMQSGRSGRQTARTRMPIGERVTG